MGEGGDKLNRKGDGEERPVRGLHRYLERFRGAYKGTIGGREELVARVQDRNKLEVVAVKK